MQLPIAYYGNPILRKKTKPVPEITDEIRQLVDDMIETMKARNGIGLAAPQVHQSLSLFITQAPIKVSPDPEDHHWREGPLLVFINPKIESYSKEVWSRDEACISIPGLFGKVERPLTIVVRAMDLDGQIFEEEYTEMAARVILHENDHINGVLYIDRLSRRERKALEGKLHEIKKKFNKPAK